MTSGAVIKVPWDALSADALTGVIDDFIHREGGRIELRFTDDHAGADFRQFQTIVYLPENCAVDSVGTSMHDAAKTVSSIQANAHSE